jgi:hypothetical protein
MTENMQARRTQSRKAVIVRYCLNIIGTGCKTLCTFFLDKTHAMIYNISMGNDAKNYVGAWRRTK